MSDSDEDLVQIDDFIDTWSSKMSTASDFQRLHNAITTNLQRLDHNVTDIENLVKKLGTPEDSDPLRDRYHRLQNDTKLLTQSTHDALQQLKNTPVSSEAEQKRKALLTDSLPKQYLHALNRFQQAQRLGVKKEKESLDRAKAASVRQQPMNDSPFGDNFVSSEQQYQQQAVLPVENVDLGVLQERDDQLKRLEGDIIQVNEIFKDVSKLIHEQGAVIDSIETHCIDTETYVQNAQKDLTKAVGWQSSARRKKIIIISILLVVLAIIILVLVLVLRK